jgi:acetyl-CoA synthetase
MTRYFDPEKVADMPWQTLRDQFRWQVPQQMNIAHLVCDRHARDRTKIALHYEDESGEVRHWTFYRLQQDANRLANALRGLGVRRGDRVGIVLPQRPETAIAHLAIYKLGAIAIPLANLFGPDALEYRLQNAGAQAVLIDGENLPKIAAIRERLPELKHVLLIDGEASDAELDFAETLQQASADFTNVPTTADDPATLIFTSGTTGPPKGALHAQRFLLGHLPGFELSHDFSPAPGDIGWTPADWAWIGGLMDLLMPCWYFGLPVVAQRARKFDPERALRLMQDHGVRNTFLPPTALKFMRQVPNIRQRYKLRLRTIISGGESLGESVLTWAREEMGVTVNEFYGQTEVNFVVGNSQTLFPPVGGSMGRAYPGHEVEIIDDAGQVLPAGEQGEIAFRRGEDPVFFLRYWNDEEATREKFAGDWARSGDFGVKDERGQFWFRGRKDDVIGSAGYRIGPAEIEASLAKHPAVALSAAIGVPDELRGQVVKAFIVPAVGYEPSDALASEIRQHVKTFLAAHEYPREIEFVASLPLTTTGKIMRRELRQREEDLREEHGNQEQGKAI